MTTSEGDWEAAVLPEKMYYHLLSLFNTNYLQ